MANAGQDFKMDELELLRQRVQQLETELTDDRQNVSSELSKMRESLAQMIVFIRTLLEDENEEWYTREYRREFYTIVKEHTDRLYRIIQNLQILKYAGPRFVMDWEANVDICKITETVVAQHPERTDKYNLALDVGLTPILVEADAERYEMLLSNLISSAIKYSPDGGEIRVRVRLEPPNKKCPCATLLIQVKDQGLGLTKQEVSRLSPIIGLEERKQPSSRGGRSPLPSSIYSLIKVYRGIYWLESEGRNKGTTYNVRLPVKQPKIED